MRQYVYASSSQLSGTSPLDTAAGVAEPDAGADARGVTTVDLDVDVDEALYREYASRLVSQKRRVAEVTYAHNHVLDDRRCDDNGATALRYLRHVADDLRALAILGERDDSRDLRLEEFRLLVRLDADEDYNMSVKDGTQGA